MASLPWETIVNILSRLPVEDLLRYRCVSKRWCSLIDGPRFIKMHLDHSMETSSHLTLIRAGRQLHSVDLDTLNKVVRLDPPIGEARGMEILGGSNGLVALANSEGDMAFGNPATRKFMKVPISDLREHCGRSEFGVVGFGYDPVDDDHKFLRMIHYYGRDGHLLNSQVKVYSLKSNTWKRVGDFPFKGVHRGIGVLVGSSLHWMMGIQLPDFSTSCLALAFDLVTGKYRRIPFPDKKIAQDKNFFTTMTELGGWLCELTKYRAGDTDWVDHVDIWVMKQYGVKESWVKLFSVVPSDLTSVFNDAMPLAYLKNTHQVLVDLDGGKIMLFDLEMNKAKSARKISDCPQRFNTSISVGSLVGFGGLGGRDGDNDGKMAEENGDKEENQEQSGQKRDDFLSKGFDQLML